MAENTPPDAVYDAAERQALLRVVTDSIAHGLRAGEPLQPNVNAYPPPLREARATFVTLHLHGRLRGCIGTLQAQRPLVADVAYNAFAAAFRDPRFPPVTLGEHVLLESHISVLSSAQPMQFTDEADLRRQIRPGIDGLILADRGRRGTFLPSVWEQLPDVATFLTHLKRKAGLPEDYWSSTLTVERYTAESIP